MEKAKEKNIRGFSSRSRFNDWSTFYGSIYTRWKKKFVWNSYKCRRIKNRYKDKKDEDNLDGLNFLAGKTMDYVNKQAMQGTIEAHASGGVPNIIINIKKLNEETIGELIYFFELACAISGNILGVNPFDQPGVEAYKKNMFRLLGKPGYEK